MDRFFIPHLPEQSATFTIDDPEEFHHLAHVLRLKPGVRAEFVNGKGLLVVAELTSIAHKEAVARVVESHLNPAPIPRVILACAIPKRAKFEDIIDKCTQLGADEIIPLMTERTEATIREKDTAAKLVRFEKVMIAAVKQSKRLWAPDLRKPCTVADALHRITSDTVALIPWLEGERTSMKEALVSVQPRKEILILIGPEGDFTAGEVELARARGAIPVSLGGNVLRVDTAAELVVGLAVLLGRER